MVQTPTKRNALHELGYKIFLDRYAQKDMNRSTLAVGDLVIVVVNAQSGQREIGKVKALDLPTVTIELLDGEVVTRDLEHVDKPLETDPAQMMDRVAAGIASTEKTPELQAEWTERFRWLLDDFKFVPGGRILTAAGTDQLLSYYNCYVLDLPHDSRSGILKTLSEMTEIMSRGGGVGITLSSLRPRHAYVKGVNGRSSGSVSWGALYSFVTGLIEQGGSRRGALMLLLADWHPDVFEFINSKRKAGNIVNANISVAVSDKFMDALKRDDDWELVFPDTSDPDYDDVWTGDLEKWIASGRQVHVYQRIKARELWNAIIESAWASAEPGLLFLERYNKMANSFYFAPIVGVNPCVTGDTLIYTDQGLVRARALFDSEQSLQVTLDGRFGVTQTFAPSPRVFMTGIKPVYRLQTREGYYIRATNDHRVMTPEGWTPLQDLKPGSQIHILNRKGGFGTGGTLELGRVLGWLVGDGSFNQKEASLRFYGDEKHELAQTFAEYTNTLVQPLNKTRRNYPVGVLELPKTNEARVSSARLRTIAAQYGLVEEKHRVPEAVLRGSEDLQRGFLQALFTADGSLQDSGEKGASARLAANSITLLEGVQQLLLNFGIASRIYRQRRAAGYRMLPDSKRNLASYWCEAQHELVISKRNLTVFADEIGFLLQDKQGALEGYLSRLTRGTYAENYIATVESLTYEGDEEVFDLTEPLTHSFVANGMIVHNCGEEGLPANGVCNLGALNLSRFYDADAHDVAWDMLRDAVRFGTRFLDNVVDANYYFFDKNSEQQLGERRLGLGTMGVAELLIRLGLRYGSEEAIQFLDRLYGFITTQSYLMSSEIAAEKGAFPNFDAEQFLQSGFMRQMPDDVRQAVRQKGIRNVTLVTVAPTGTTGTLVNTSTGIEPFFSWVYYRKSRLGLHEEQVPLVKEWFEAHPGETELPDYFVTAMDLSPEEHVRVQGTIQRWIDSSISKTANLPNDYTIEQVGKLYEYMYELGCKGGTVYRDGSRDEQVLMLKGDERAESELAQAAPAEPDETPIEQVATPHYVYPRPGKLQGVTVTCKTPYGTAYVTMNSDEQGFPFEVFITAPGKAGSDLQADAEGLGRMISLQLRTTAPQNRRQMLKLVIDQLQGIGGARSIGMGAKRVLSLPDAVAGALMEHYFPEDKAQQLGLFNGMFDVPVEPAQPVMSAFEEVADKHNPNGAISGADMCPSCGTISLVRAEGCRKCLTCGYSEC